MALQVTYTFTTAKDYLDMLKDQDMPRCEGDNSPSLPRMTGRIEFCSTTMGGVNARLSNDPHYKMDVPARELMRAALDYLGVPASGYDALPA